MSRTILIMAGGTGGHVFGSGVTLAARTLAYAENMSSGCGFRKRGDMRCQRRLEAEILHLQGHFARWQDVQGEALLEVGRDHGGHFLPEGVRAVATRVVEW